MAVGEFEMYCVQLQKYILYTNVRVDPSSDIGFCD